MHCDVRAIQLPGIAMYWLVLLGALLFDKLDDCCFVACALVLLALRLLCSVLIAHGLELVSCSGFGPASCQKPFQGASVQVQVVWVLDEWPEASFQPRHLRVARASEQNGPASLKCNSLIG